MRSAVVGIALVLLAGAGAYEFRTRAGGVDPVVASAVQAKLDSIPNGVGDWVGEELDYDAKQMDRTGSFASLYRLYRNAKTNEAISVLILAGPAQEIGSHDPNRCYVGAGYRPVGAAAKKSMSDATALGPCGYWAARFDTDTFPAASLQVVWAWSVDGRWVASDNARYEFVREPALLKLYVSRRMNGTDTEAVDPTEGFLSEFFPVVQSSLAVKGS